MRPSSRCTTARVPDTRQRLYTVLPGAVGGAALWVTAAATLVFLYLGATMPIFGAEINGVLREKTST